MNQSKKSTKNKLTVADIPHVGAGTPAGEWFRRYWLVVGTVHELHDIPQAVKVLGEELVLFRDSNGQLGLLGEHCPHRGTSLEYGDIEDGGLRCPYHGWLFDVHGRCLEMPAEPEDSKFCEKVKQLSYPVRELGGLIFAYMGPEQANPPPLPQYAPLLERGGQRQVEPVRQADYNWFNFFENSADPAHVCVLHRHAGYGQQSWGDHFFSYTDMPDVEFVEMDYGMKVVMTKPGPRPGTEFVDEMSLALPGIVQVGDTEFVHAKMDAAALINEGSRCEHWMFVTPNDDDHFMLFTADNYTGPVENFFERLKEM
ncbi:MAG TPA: Rieske 2Fe-2S domain-containing protein, partial [Candidatus Deferrimicrobium sp.]|nr:Rieske 2Fe-2S domain-containing protein [Candidatus Deferrimicrobium sp.]